VALKPHVRRWYELAEPVIGTKDFAVTYVDFLRGWPLVEHPLDAEYIPEVFAQARKKPAVGLDDERLGILATACRLLAAGKGDGVFFLACRTAGEQLGVSHSIAADLLVILQAEKIIRLVRKGGTAENPREASRFRYIGPDRNEESGQGGTKA
jgi:hypothetical protein